MSSAQDLYSILGVPASATLDDIRLAYRAMAKRLHPDANANPGAANQFKTIATAYEVLGDISSRSRYDMQRQQQTNSDRAYYTLRITPSKRVVPILQEP